MAIYKDIQKVNKDVYDVDAINQSLKNIILTRKGSVPGKPKFGSDIYKILFNPIDHITENILKRYIQEAIQEWEDRVQILEVIVEEIPEYNKVVSTLKYKFLSDKLNQEYTTTVKLSS